MGSLIADMVGIDSKTEKWIKYKEGKKRLARYMTMVRAKQQNVGTDGTENHPSSKWNVLKRSLSSGSKRPFAHANKQLSSVGDRERRRRSSLKAMLTVKGSGVNREDTRCVNIQHALETFKSNQQFLALMMGKTYKAYTDYWQGVLASAVNFLDMDRI